MNEIRIFAAAVLVLFAAGVNAQPGDEAAAAAPHQLDLFALIDRVATETGKEIVYFSLFPAVNSTAGAESDFETLQAVLRTISYMTVENDDQILILPDAAARSMPTPVLQDDDRRVSDHAFVTRVITIPSIEIQTSDGPQTVDGAPQLVPIIRPMLSTNAQLGAVQGTGKLIIVDRYDNVRRITEVIDDIVGDR